MASLPPLVTLADFGTWVGEDLTGDQQAAMILDAASALVRAEARRTWTDDSGNLVDVPEQPHGLRSRPGCPRPGLQHHRR